MPFAKGNKLSVQISKFAVHSHYHSIVCDIGGRDARVHSISAGNVGKSHIILGCITLVFLESQKETINGLVLGNFCNDFFDKALATLDSNNWKDCAI